MFNNNLNIDSKDPLGTRFSDFRHICFLIRAEMAICATVQEIQILSTFRTLKDLIED